MRQKPNVKIVEGTYENAIEYCAKEFNNDYFEFDFPLTKGAERFRELDRFLWESKHTRRFVNEYEGNVVIDVSEWNENGCFDEHFNSFMYFLKDRSDKYNCIFITNKPCTDELTEKLESFFQISKKNLDPEKLNTSKKVKLGFDTTNSMEVENIVRS